MVEAYRHQKIIADTNAAYAALQSDPESWLELQEEIAVLDGVLGDGVDGVRTEDGEPPSPAPA